MGILNIGNNSYVRVAEIEVILPIESAPVRRLINDAKDTGKCVECTFGSKAKTVVVLRSGKVALSTVSTKTLAERLGDKAE